MLKSEIDSLELKTLLQYFLYFVVFSHLRFSKTESIFLTPEDRHWLLVEPWLRAIETLDQILRQDRVIELLLG